jgi:hypothetical protein
MARRKNNKPAVAPADSENTAEIAEVASDSPVSTTESPDTLSDSPDSSSDFLDSSSDSPAEVVEEKKVERAHAEDGRFVADNKGTQPDESIAGEDAARPVSQKAKEQAVRLAESYFGAGKVSKGDIGRIVAALEIGHQPCIVRNVVGNEQFSLRVFETVFDKNDKSNDAVDGSIKLNIARRLAHAGLYPTRG